MPNRPEERNRNLNESSLRDRTVDPAADTDEAVTEDALDRLEDLIGGAEEPAFADRRTERELNKLHASTDEEVDALRLNLVQDGEPPNTRDGTGRITDDLAAEHIASLTEVGPDLPDKGVVSIVPGREDTSRVLRRHHPDTVLARAQDVVEGNLEEPRDPGLNDRKVDEGTAA